LPWWRRLLDRQPAHHGLRAIDRRESSAGAPRVFTGRVDDRDELLTDDDLFVVDGEPDADDVVVLDDDTPVDLEAEFEFAEDDDVADEFDDDDEFDLVDEFDDEFADEEIADEVPIDVDLDERGEPTGVPTQLLLRGAATVVVVGIAVILILAGSALAIAKIIDSLAAS
jgi:hypothetical protein